jgi:hypothetical protein
LPFQYKDGWLFSLGAEYMMTEKMKLRGGVGFEKSPITDDVRIPLLPDNDRYWLSVGASYQMTPKLSFDLAYSHLFVKSTPINVVAGNPWWTGVDYVGTVDSHVDIISVAMKYRWIRRRRRRSRRSTTNSVSLIAMEKGRQRCRPFSLRPHMSWPGLTRPSRLGRQRFTQKLKTPR